MTALGVRGGIRGGPGDSTKVRETTVWEVQYKVLKEVREMVMTEECCDTYPRPQYCQAAAFFHPRLASMACANVDCCQPHAWMPTFTAILVYGLDHIKPFTPTAHSQRARGLARDKTATEHKKNHANIFGRKIKLSIQLDLPRR